MANNIQIGADTSGFVSGVNRARTAMAGLGEVIQSSTQGNVFAAIAQGMPVLGAAAAVFAGVAVAAKGMFSAMEAGGALSDLEDQTGVAIDTLMHLQLAFEQCGMAASDVQPVLNKLQKQVTEAATGSAEAIDKFSRMGIAIGDIQGLSADKQLEKVGDAISKIENPAQRAAMAIEIFGRGGGKMLSVFSSGGLKDAQKNIGQQAQLMAQNAGIFDRTTDVLGTAGRKIQGLFVGMASEIVPELMGVIEALNDLDLSFIGQAFGNALSFWINYFKNFGTQGDLIYNTMKLAFMGAINFLDEELRVLLAGAAASFKNVFKGQAAQEKAIKEAETLARARGPLLDTTETEAAMQRDADTIEASKQATAEKAREDNKKKEKPDSGLGFISKMNSGFTGGMPDISSLQKIGGGSALLSGGQDNSPAYQAVRIQEDILTYTKELVQIIKQGGTSYQTSPNLGSSMVLTA
jgi:hypothetical protein